MGEQATTGYVGRKYGGRTPHFQCLSCPYDSFDQERVQRHVAQVHPEVLRTPPADPPADAPTAESAPAQPDDKPETKRTPPQRRRGTEKGRSE